MSLIVGGQCCVSSSSAREQVNFSACQHAEHDPSITWDDRALLGEGSRRSGQSRLIAKCGTTDTTEVAKTTRSRFEALDHVRTRQQLVSIDVDITSESGAAKLAAIVAMAMGKGSNCINLEFDKTAETTAFDHRAVLIPVLLRDYVTTHLYRTAETFPPLAMALTQV